VGDYLLWNWSLTNGHDVVALIAGLTLLPIGAAWVWLLTLSLARLARLLVRSARRGSSISARRRGAGAGAHRDPQRAREPGVAARALEEPAGASTAASSGSPSRKLAA